MPRVIAMAGKGGTGKTTITALLINFLLHRKMTPVLAVDADANANLNELLGLKVDLTLGEIRKNLKGEMPPNITRDQFMEMQVHQALIESSGFDLLVMGQPDGPGCYCAANQYLAMTMDQLAANYEFILVDNEAGMEHLSRMNLRYIDFLLVISDPSARGILTARRIAELTGPLGIEIKNKFLIINRAPESMSADLKKKITAAIEGSGMSLAGFIPESSELTTQEIKGESYLDLPAHVQVLAKSFELFSAIIK